MTHAKLCHDTGRPSSSTFLNSSKHASNLSEADCVAAIYPSILPSAKVAAVGAGEGSSAESRKPDTATV